MLLFYANYPNGDSVRLSPNSFFEFTQYWFSVNQARKS